jgi:UPF0755 protein
VVKRRRTAWVVFGTLLALLAALAALDGYAEHWYHAPLPGVTEPIAFEVAPGQPLAVVARALESRGVLDHAWLWTAIARRDGKATRIKAGEYAIAPGVSPAALLDAMVEGRVLLHSVTLVEGWTFAMALTAIQSSPFITTTLPPTPGAALMLKLGSPGVPFEGRLFPDTYLVPRGATDLDVLKQAHARLEERLAAAWAARRPDLPLANDHEALILASIVEKETGAPEERPHIAAVFVNRLRRGMRLQTDPTVIYGLGAAYDGSIHRHDLTTDTPYNTYTRDGLPPTPIALPSAAALAAAVQPLASEDLYFVATGRGDGRHVFSRTLEQHNVAVGQYLARLRGAQSGSR